MESDVHIRMHNRRQIITVASLTGYLFDSVRWNNKPNRYSDCSAHLQRWKRWENKQVTWLDSDYFIFILFHLTTTNEKAITGEHGRNSNNSRNCIEMHLWIFSFWILDRSGVFVLVFIWFHHIGDHISLEFCYIVVRQVLWQNLKQKQFDLLTDFLIFGTKFDLKHRLVFLIFLYHILSSCFVG